MGPPPSAAPVSSPFAPSGQDAALVAAIAGEAAPAEAGPPPPAMLAPMGASPQAAPNGGVVAAPPAAGIGDPPAPAMGAAMGAAPSADDELAASPWNRANNPGLNRDLLPSAMITSAPEPSPPSKKAAKPLAPEEPSRAPWIIVGLLVVVAAIAGGVAVFLIKGKQGPGGPIAVPAGAQTSTTDDGPADTSAPTVAATASAAPKPTQHYRPAAPPTVKAKPLADDPYADVPSSGGRGRSATPSSSPTAAKGRVFGVDN
jgi:hypothetical protein